MINKDREFTTQQITMLFFIVYECLYVISVMYRLKYEFNPLIKYRTVSRHLYNVLIMELTEL